MIEIKVVAYKIVGYIVDLPPLCRSKGLVGSEVCRKMAIQGWHPLIIVKQEGF